MKKLVFVIIFFCFCFNIVLAFVPTKENFVIYNLPSNAIIVNYEFFSDPIYDGQTYEQQINDINISIHNDLCLYQIAPFQKKTCISYYPAYGILYSASNNFFERLKNIPILSKIKSIFKSFTITDMDGNVLITLEALKEDNIKKIGDNAYPQYILEIYDEDLQGK